MKIVQINAVCGSGSTGKICVAISKLLTQQKIENYILYSLGNSDYPLGIKFTNKYYIKIQSLISRVLGNYGFNSIISTRKLIEKLNQIKPDIVHLHNIHSHDCNLDMLFKYLKSKKIKVFWTFHDCWAFTGYCPYFDMVKCENWKEICHNCPQRKKYAWFFDKSTYLYNKKKELFNGIDLTIITPSRWLAGLVKQSFLKNHKTVVINNGINLNVFKPVENNFKKIQNIENKFVILGIAFGWEERKGLDVFIRLSQELDDNFQIILIGTDDKVDRELPDNIISIHRTNNQQQLAEIYSAADLFVNPTKEENYPTVNMEAIACGTPVLTYNTGGSGEIPDNNTGIVIEKNDFETLKNTIISFATKDDFFIDNFIKRAQFFDENIKFKEYVNLYLKGE